MARLEISGFDELPIAKIKDDDIRRTIVREMLWAGGRTMKKCMERDINARHHISGDLAKSVIVTDVHEVVDGGYVEIYPDGEDRRGVSNYMKHKIINTGAWHKGSAHRWKKDPYMKRVERENEQNVQKMMRYQMELSMKKLGLTD